MSLQNVDYNNFSDMHNDKLIDTLNSIGKAFFVNYLKAAASNYSNADIARAIAAETSYTVGSCRVRISKMRAILRAERTRDALSLIVKSQVTNDTRLNAIKQLHEHL